MAYALSNGLSVALIIGQAEFPLDAVNRIRSLHMVESVQLQVPQLTIELIDTTGLLEKIGLQDGMPITISIKQKSVVLQTIPFRLYSYKPIRENYAQLYNITAYLDIPKYWFGLAQRPFRGTSYEALAVIAAECGLSYIGTYTNDSQLWMPNCLKYCEYAKYISDRGYVSNMSCMVLGITLLKTMYYVDIMNQSSPTVVLRSLDKASDSEYPVASYKVSGFSGSAVTNGGYFTTRVSPSIVLDNGYYNSINRVEVKQNVNSPQINSVVRNMIGNKQIINYGLIDCGNASQMHEAAIYQNSRLKSLFSITGEFVLTNPCPLTLCIPFTFYATNADGTAQPKDSGVYVTCSRTIYIAEGNYYEKISASRIGTNAEYYSN